jgi:hypothetical protein
MTRHVIDKSTLRDTAQRVREFLRIDRQAGLHPAVRALHVRVQDERGSARLEQYLRIERGRQS